MSTTATAVAPTQNIPVAPAIAQTLAEKLAAKKLAVAAAPSKANRLSLNLDYDDKELQFSCKISDFLAAVKPSQSGTTEGLMVSLAGRFQYEVDGETYTFELAHAQGGGAWVISRMIL